MPWGEGWKTLIFLGLRKNPSFKGSGGGAHKKPIGGGAHKKPKYRDCRNI